MSLRRLTGPIFRSCSRNGQANLGQCGRFHARGLERVRISKTPKCGEQWFAGRGTRGGDFSGEMRGRAAPVGAEPEFDVSALQGGRRTVAAVQV